MKTKYIAAYDTEAPRVCLDVCCKIRAVHEQFAFPATFFIVGKRLEDEGDDYREVIGTSPLFEIGSHTYSHIILRDHPFCGNAPDDDVRRREIELGKRMIEETFERPCVGLRPGCGFPDGLTGDPWLVDVVAAAGFQYVSSLLWGPDMTVPALLEEPFTYAEAGHPNLWELPGHGWHENLLKGHNVTVEPRRIIAWPSPFPEAVPMSPVSTPAEEFAVHKLFIDKAVERELPYVSLIWHPWSLGRFDPEMAMLQQTFAYVQALGLEPVTYEDMWRTLSEKVG